MSEKRRYESSNSISSLCRPEVKRPCNHATLSTENIDELDSNVQNYLRMMIHNVIEGTQPFTQELYDSFTQHIEWIDSIVDNEETSQRLIELVAQFRAQNAGYRGENTLEGEHYNNQSDEEDPDEEDNNDDVFNY